MTTEHKKDVASFLGGARIKPSTLVGAPVLADGQIQPVTDQPGVNLYVRKGGVLVPAVDATTAAKFATTEPIVMAVDPSTGTSPPAGTIVTNQAEYDALGYDLKYPQDALDILPPVIKARVIIHLLVGTHLAKPDSYAPGMSTMLYVSSKFYETPDGLLDFSSPSFTKDINFVGDESTILDVAQAGTVSVSHKVTRTAGTWAVNEHKGMFCLFTTGVNAGAKVVIVSNTTTELITEGPALTSGACTFEIVSPAAVLIGSSDGVTACYCGPIVTGAAGGYWGVSGVNLWNVQLGNAAFPCLMSTLVGSYLNIDGSRVLLNDWAGFNVVSSFLRLANGYLKLEASGYSGINNESSSIVVISQSFLEFAVTDSTPDYCGFLMHTHSVLHTWYTTYKALPSHLAGKPLFRFERGGVFFPEGHFTVDGSGLASCLSVGPGSAVKSDMNLTVNNCMTAYACDNGGSLYVSNGAGSGNTNGFVLDSGGLMQAANPAGLGATNPIVIDGITHPYTDLPSAGDTIVGQHGSKIGRS